MGGVDALTRVAAGLKSDFNGVIPDDINIEVRIARAERAIDAGVETLGAPSCFACPDCHGVLLQLNNTRPERFRCHTGHAYTLDALVAAISEKSDEALWMALRSLEEEGLLMHHLSSHLEDHPDRSHAELLIARAREIESRAELVRQATMNREGVSK